MRLRKKSYLPWRLPSVVQIQEEEDSLLKEMVKQIFDWTAVFVKTLKLITKTITVLDENKISFIK